MINHNLFKLALVVFVSTVVLAGCSMVKQDSTTEYDLNGDDVTNNTVGPEETTETSTQQPEPTLSNSTEINDLEKDLENTTIKSEDFSDL